jgi:hypothetical protein
VLLKKCNTLEKRITFGMCQAQAILMTRLDEELVFRA